MNTAHRAVLASQDITSDNFEIRTDYEYRLMFNRLLKKGNLSVPIPIQVVMICAMDMLKYRQKEEIRNFYTCPYTLSGDALLKRSFEKIDFFLLGKKIVKTIIDRKKLSEKKLNGFRSTLML